MFSLTRISPSELIRTNQAISYQFLVSKYMYFKINGFVKNMVLFKLFVLHKTEPYANITLLLAILLKSNYNDTSWDWIQFEG